jgi:asparagine synthetase B (glutamine-hydrolysing)
MKLSPEDEGKWLLRRAMKKRLPPAITTRSKMGFTVPLKDLLASAKDLVKDVMNSPSPLSDQLDELRILRFFNDYYAGKNEEHLKAWTIFTLHYWLRTNRSA